MLNKFLPLILLAILSWQTNTRAESVTEAKSFYISVTLPQSVSFMQATAGTATSLAETQQEATQLVQEQQLVRNNRTLLIRSVVAL